MGILVGGREQRPYAAQHHDLHKLQRSSYTLDQVLQILGLVTDVGIFRSHANHHTSMPGAANDGGEHRLGASSLAKLPLHMPDPLENGIVTKNKCSNWDDMEKVRLFFFFKT